MARGISTATIARRAALFAIAAAAATGLSACGAGQVTQTDTKQTAVAGVNVDAEYLALRDLQVEYSGSEGYDAGETAPLRVWISNNSNEPVSLLAVETDAAEQVALVDGGEPGVDVVETTEPPEAPTDEEGAGDEGVDDQSGEGETTDAPADSEAPTETVGFEPIELAPGAFVRLDQGVESGDYLVLEGLAEPLMPGQDVTVTFIFSDGQEVTTVIPVGQPMTGDGERSYLENPGYDH